MKEEIAVQSEAAGRRAAAYWFIDGLPEILFGVVYLAWGSLGLAWGADMRNPWMKWAMVLVILLFLTLLIKDRAILDYFKARLTYPRTGYVRPPAEPAPDRDGELVSLNTAPPVDWNVTTFRMRTAFIFFVASSIVEAPIGPIANRRWSVAVLMAVVAVAIYVWSRREARPYSWQSALAIAVAGLLSAGLEVPPKSRQFLPLWIGGAWLLAHGVPTLVRYLRTYPAPKGEGA